MWQYFGQIAVQANKSILVFLFSNSQQVWGHFGKSLFYGGRSKYMAIRKNLR